MTVKTITVTEEAYEALKRLKMENESFSEGIMRVSQQKTNPVTAYFGILKNSRKKLDELRESVKKGRLEFDKEARERGEKIRKRIYGSS